MQFGNLAQRNGHDMDLTLTHPIGKRGIEIFGLYYQSEALQHFYVNHAPRSVTIRINRFDISTIAVALVNGEWLTVDFSYPDPHNTTVGEWLAAAKRRASIRTKKT